MKKYFLTNPGWAFPSHSSERILASQGEFFIGAGNTLLVSTTVSAVDVSLVLSKSAHSGGEKGGEGMRYSYC